MSNYITYLRRDRLDSVLNVVFRVLMTPGWETAANVKCEVERIPKLSCYPCNIYRWKVKYVLSDYPALIIEAHLFNIRLIVWTEEANWGTIRQQSTRDKKRSRVLQLDNSFPIVGLSTSCDRLSLVGYNSLRNWVTVTIGVTNFSEITKKTAKLYSC
jgi:hypothetical protein